MFSHSETKFPELAKTLTVGLSPLVSRAQPCMEMQCCSAEAFYCVNSNVCASDGGAWVGLQGQKHLQSMENERGTAQLSLQVWWGMKGGLVLLFMREVKVGRSDRQEKQITQEFQELNCLKTSSPTEMKGTAHTGPAAASAVQLHTPVSPQLGILSSTPP